MRSVSAAEMVERRASFWGFGGIGGGGTFSVGVAVGRGASNGEVSRSGKGAFG